MNKHACVIVIYSIFAHMCVFVHLLINLFYFIFYGGTDHPPYKSGHTAIKSRCLHKRGSLSSSIAVSAPHLQLVFQHTRL